MSLLMFLENRFDPRDPNDDRSDSMNPNNESHKAAMDNHANQLNSNHEEYQG